MYHFSNHQLYHQSAYQQPCPIIVEHTKQSNIHANTQNQFEVLQHNIPCIQPEATEIQLNPQTITSNIEKRKKVVTNKGSVDTSNFSIEERLVAAVWVHERKNNKSSMSQIKHEFRQRFGREPPAKNTLLVWERKLFSTGSVHDAPRPGRPIHRRNRMDEVAASVRTAPSMSLRARALALRVPRTTLRTILYNDLSHTSNKTKDVGLNNQTGTHSKRNMKKPARRKLDHQVQHNMAGAPTGRTLAGSLRHSYT